MITMMRLLIGASWEEYAVYFFVSFKIDLKRHRHTNARTPKLKCWNGARRWKRAKKREKKINKLSTCSRVIPDILNKTELIINSFRNAYFFVHSQEKKVIPVPLYVHIPWAILFVFQNLWQLAMLKMVLCSCRLQNRSHRIGSNWIVDRNNTFCTRSKQ